MSKLDPGLFPINVERGTSTAQPVAVLAIGTIEQWIREFGALPEPDEFTFSSFHEVTGETIVTLNPSLILSPVVAPNFDCVDVAMLLTKIGYSGPYRAVTARLPKPDIVRREIRAHCPAIDFDVITV